MTTCAAVYSDDDDDDNKKKRPELVEYHVFGHALELLPKYLPPFNPIGRGAYGFVW
jgi:hypothetical protein